MMRYLFENELSLISGGVIPYYAVSSQTCNATINASGGMDKMYGSFAQEYALNGLVYGSGLAVAYFLGGISVSAPFYVPLGIGIVAGSTILGALMGVRVGDYCYYGK